jgi:Leucine-rich repeat (LRR) protein
VGNHIESLDALKQLSVLKKLQEVDFSENPVAEKSNYRSTLFDT